VLDFIATMCQEAEKMAFKKALIENDYGSEWRADAREYYMFTSTEEETEEMEYDEEF